MAAVQVLIVGAGVTGSMLAFLVKEMGLSVRVLEKSRAAGGRMNTHSFRLGDRSTPVLAHADLGAQYITTRSAASHPVLGALYDSLLNTGVLAPFTGEVAGPNPYGGAGDEVRHFTAPKGLRAVSEQLLKAAGVEVDWGASVDDVSVSADGEASVLAKGGEPLKPSVVVLTQPVSQVLGASKFPVRGNFLNHTEDAVLTGLKKVQYSSRFAVAFFFDPSKVAWPYSWAARYFDKGDVRYVAHDTAKRGAKDEAMISVVVHSGVPLGMEFLEEEEPFTAAADRLLKDLQTKLPELPWSSPQGMKVQKWKYSQVYKGIGGSKLAPDWVWSSEASAPGYVELFRSEKSLGLLAGDALAPASNFEGCVYSAHKAAEALKSYFGSPDKGKHGSGGGYGSAGGSGVGDRAAEKRSDL